MGSSEVEDFALADSFLNFDYVPDVPAPDNRSDPPVVGSGSSDSGYAANCSIEEGIEKISLDGIGNNEEMASWGIDSSDDDDRAARRPVRSKNRREILPWIPPVNVTLGPHHQMLPVGVVMSILDAQVIVEGVEKHDPLNEGSILWMTENRTPLGLIDEIFGPVKNPYYIVRYNSEKEVPEGIRVGTLISFVPEFANHVLNNKDLHKKGYDTSGVNDEEVSDDGEFSDDEKEAEYNRMQRMTKRGINDQNPRNGRNNRNKFPPKDGFVPTFPVAPATPMLDHGHCSPIPGIGQGLVRASNVNPPFPPTNACPNLTTSGVWTNGSTFPLQQSSMLPNGFLPNGVTWYPENTQIPHQFPVPGIPFQQQLNPFPGCPPATIFPGVQPNIFTQLMNAQGPVNQNQITFGLSSPFTQIQPLTNLHSSSISGNPHAPYQFTPGSSANHGRQTFHRGGSKGWRPAK
ncbi:Translation protein, beta-barrel domain superfamily [Sesbania bispinosa]|nr:Translation protein, beta-barrel domain superfamily [Sesbania bispinosa]